MTVEKAIDRIVWRLDQMEKCLRKLETDFAAHRAASESRLTTISNYQRTGREKIAIGVAAAASAAAAIALVV